MNNVNSAWMYLKDVLLQALNKHAPIVEKRVKSHFCPWLDTKIHQLQNERNKTLKYLGSTIDPNSIMNEHFGIAYKKSIE